MPADLPELQRVYRAASLSNAGDRPLLLANPQFLAFPGDGLAEGRTRVAVGAEPRILGFASVAVSESGEAEVEDLFVDPDRRRRGIARRLVEDAVRTLRQQGHDHVAVTANAHAMAFYLSVGFVRTGEVSTELGRAARLRLDLPGPSRDEPA